MSETHLKNIREEFLKIFIKSLILNSYKPEKNKIEAHLQKEHFIPSIAATKPKVREALPPISKQIPSPIILPKIQTLKSKGKIPMALPRPPPQKLLKPGEKPDSIHLGKVASLLLDPSVLSIECSGPGRNLMVNRSGVAQSTSLILTKEEIDSIMRNFSEKTKIPLISGVFHAAFKDLILTAVISEFVGTRFIIEKRYDYQLPMQ